MLEVEDEEESSRAEQREEAERDAHSSESAQDTPNE